MNMSEQDLNRLLKSNPSIKIAGVGGHNSPLPIPTQPQEVIHKPAGKYGNHKVTVDGETFDSKREYARYNQLKMMEQSGAIQKLTRQVSFELAPSVHLAGEKRRKPALTYKADFTYVEMGKLVCEDSKGCVTDVFRIKQHLMKHIHGIDIILS